MAIDDNESYELTGYQVKDLAQKIRAKADSSSLATVATSGLYSDLTGAPTIPTVYNGTLTVTQNGASVGTFTANQSGNTTVALTDTTYSDFVGSTTSAAGVAGLVPAPTTSDPDKYLKGDGTWAEPAAKLVEMSYGESNAWAKFIAAYNAGAIVYCRASSNANPATGSQTRKAFMAYVNNATSPTNVEFQYVRSQSSKSDSQQCDQVFIYKLTNASGGTWSVETRDMATKVNVNSTLTKTYSGGANASMTLGAKSMTGATSSTAGTAGIVPAPAAGDENKVLTGAGAWVDMAGSYSTSEVETPYTWVDGKTIYKKTINFGNLPSSGSKSVAHGITGLSEVVKIEGIAYTGPRYNDYTPVPLSSPSVANLSNCGVNSTNVVIEVGRDKSSFTAYITIWYTKS